MNRKERAGARLPSYAAKMIRALQGHQLMPGFYIVRILHDDWCDLLAGRGSCNCSPEVRVPPDLPGRN
jgi:hypothetical protein